MLHKFDLLDFKVFVIVFSVNFLISDAFIGVRRQWFKLEENVNVSNVQVSTKFFKQQLDHFDDTNEQTWQQRYHVNEDYFNNNTNHYAYLTLGGESETTSNCVLSGDWLYSAEKYGGLVICLEHRFYGQSQPLGNLSTENLKYLSSYQALADAANFIQGMNAEYQLPSDVKWIVRGGSYAGSLAAWMRQQYPDLVTGAVSHSGPLQAVLDFKEYLQVVLDDFSATSQDCINNIKSVYSDLEELVSICLEDSEIYKNLDNSFSLCESIETSQNNELDLANFFEILTDQNFAYMAQYNNNPGCRDINIDYMCDILANDSIGTNVDRLGQINTVLLQKQGETCLDYKYLTMVQNLQNITADPSKMMRQWIYQTCTEFGFFQTSSQVPAIFGSRFDVDFFIDGCEDLFGANFNESLINTGIEATNNRYGGKDAEISNVVFVHGSFDPWHVLGKLKVDEDNGSKAILIEGVSHCAAYYSAQEGDIPALVQARADVHELIGKWLGINDDSNSCVKINTSSLFALLLFSISLLFL